MSTKRGRPRLPVEQRRHVRITVWVRSDVAEGMYAMVGKNRRYLSEWTSSQFEKLLARERQLVTQQITQNAVK